jgi:outer membrane protein TolC
MRIFYITAITILFANSIKAQKSEVLEMYIKQGLENNLALKQKELDLEKSVMALKEANGLFYPSIEASSQYMIADGGRSINLPIGDLLNPVYSTLNQILSNSGQTGNFPQISNQKVQFLENDYHDTKLRVIMPLLNAEIYYNRKIKKEMISVAQSETNVFKRELIKEIKTAYFKYLQSIKVVDAYNSARNLVKEALRVNEKLVKNQMTGNDKLLRIQAELSQVEAQLTKAQNDSKTAVAYFNFLLNNDLNSNVLIDSLLFKNNKLINYDSSYFFSHKRDELIQLKNYGNATGLLLNMKNSYWVPVISNVTDFGYQGNQYKFNSDQQYAMNVIEIKWSIFNGFQNRRKVKQAKIDKLTVEKKYSEVEQQIKLQQQVAIDNLETSDKTEKANLSSLNSSAEYFKVVSRQYEEGQKSLLDLLDARNQLTNSNINYSISHFETLIKLAELERAIGSFDLR